jgi:tellurite resistance protein TerC
MEAIVDLWIWVALLVAIGGLLAVDLLVLHRDAHEVSFKEATFTSMGWIGIGLAFGVGVWLFMGPTAGGEYFAGYLIEKALAVDNIFVFALIFAAVAVPKRLQHRVLFWGVVGALVFRGIFIAGGALVLERFHWTIYVFGALLILTGVKMLLARNSHPDPSRSPVLRAFRRVVPMTEDYEGQRFVVRRGRALLATPLLAALVLVETSDIIFAVDSIPAIFAVTDDPFIVFASNAFAILGLRALYFMLAGLIDRFVYLKVGLSAVLLFVGGKMLLSSTVKVPIGVSLAVIAAMVGVSIVLSLRATRDRGPEKETEPEPEPESAFAER